MKPLNCVTIVGVGLIGGSIGLAMATRKLAERIVGVGSRPATLESALTMGAVTEVAASLPKAVREAELVIVCAPVGAIVDVVSKIAPHCRAGALITDAGSTKAEIVDALEQARANGSAWPRGVNFVGSHPLAGNEKKGPTHADPDLFVDRVVIVTPTATTAPEDVARVRDFWSALGAKLVEMSASEHDRALAVTSHLPHLLSAAIAASTPRQYVTLTGSGWQDTTRIAAGDPALWRQILLANQANVLEWLAGFSDLLAAWRAALAAGDGDELERVLTEAKRVRDAVGN